MLQQQQHQEVLLHPIQRKIQEYRPFVRLKKERNPSNRFSEKLAVFWQFLIMVFCRNLVPILVLLVAVNSRFGLALPHQSIRLDPSDVPFIYNLNASWTETCPGGETDCAPGETCCPLKNQGKVLWNRTYLYWDIRAAKNPKLRQGVGLGGLSSHGSPVLHCDQCPSWIDSQ